MFWPRSLQNRLLLGIVVCLSAILAAGSYVAYRAMERYLRTEMDSTLRDRVRFYQASIIMKDGYPKLEFPTLDLLENEWEQIQKPQSRFHMQLWYADAGNRGKLVVRTPSLEGQDLPRPELAEGGTSFQTTALHGGEVVRVLSTVFRPRNSDPNEVSSLMQLTVARRTAGMEDTLHKVRMYALRITITATIAQLLAALWIVRGGVRTLSKLAAQIDAIPLTDSTHQINLQDAPSEVQPLVDRLNALMRRVASAIEHERQFTSNAAHELRNPLAAIRSSIELSLSRSRTVDEYVDTLHNVLESQTGLQRIVDHLLLLARLETGHQGTDFVREPVSLPILIRRTWRNAFDTAERRGIKPVWDVETSDREYLMPVSLVEIVVRNLFENAAAYAPENTSIFIVANIRAGEMQVSVTNRNPGLVPEDLERTFAPFWRSNPNASGHQGNAGIGLALSKRIMISLGGNLDAVIHNDTITYTMRLPVGRPVASSPGPVRGGPGGRSPRAENAPAAFLPAPRAEDASASPPSGRDGASVPVPDEVR